MALAAVQADRRPVSLRELFQVFLVIGAIGFGGGMAVIALIEREVVRRREWLSLDQFLHGVALGQILGPFAVNTSLFVGYQMRGLPGALVAVVGFLLPSVALVIALSAAYFRWHTLPAMQHALSALAPVVVALILAAAYTMGKPKIRDWGTGAAALAVLLVALFTKANVVLLLSLAAAYGVARCYRVRRCRRGGEP